MKFEIIQGSHFDESDRSTKTAGQIVDSHYDLSAMFLNKFTRRVDLENGSKTVAKEKASDIKPPAAVEQDLKNQEELAELSAFGKDVTPAFNTAKDADLKVFLSAKGKYTVVDPEFPDKALNKAKLSNSDAVVAFIADYVS